MQSQVVERADATFVSALLERAWAYRLALIVLVGAVLRVVGLDRQGFWTDELYVVWEGRQPLDVLFDPQLHIQHPPGYRLLLHAWMGISLDEVWIRAVPLLAGILLIPAGWVLARFLWPDRPTAADVTALLMATSPYLLHYSQDVTTYAWTSLWVTLSFLLLVAAWRSDRWWLWVGWAVSLAVSLYSHYFALFPLIIEGLGVLIVGLKGGSGALARLWHALAAIGGAVLLYLPWLWRLFAGGGQWAFDVPQGVFGIYFFPLTLDAQAFRWVPVLAAGYGHLDFWQYGWGYWLVWGALVGGAICGAWYLFRTRDGNSALGMALLAGWLVAAIVGPYLFLRITTPPDGVEPVRFGSMAAPALLIGMGGVVALMRPAWRVPVLALWLLVAGWQWRVELLSPPPQDWRGILAIVRQEGRAGDVVLAFPAFHAGAAAAYYPVPAPVRGGWFVGEGSDPTGAAYWFPPEWKWRGFLDPVARRSLDWVGEMKARTGDAGRVWYLAGDGVDGTYPPSPIAERTLSSLGWRQTGEWKASPLVLRLYTRPGGARTGDGLGSHP
jgi:hypothetical protein